MSRKTKRVMRGVASQATPIIPQLRPVKPITINQSKVFKAFNSGQHLLISGYAGTGKSFIGLYLGLRETVREGNFKATTIIRSVVPSRDIGFLPGTPEEKAAVYETPYKGITDDLFHMRGHYDHLKRSHQIEFETTSFLRGQTLRDRLLLVDEAQNMTDDEINTFMTRVGEGSRVIICGDYRQNDLQRQKSGFRNLLGITQDMPSFTHVEMGVGDIVRSGFVKEWILAKEAYDS